ncbi:DinB family protein [Cohnella lubricantis]|uniref:DinB family protein n=1 Tax=Cohnella lubricantis TaxID=2163172 RepID=A0A841TF68_9BACL|nr:DinB family protein [Cohnella lubricantis]MBB6678946.1 DinB family protein [Cohnella lubricantis]MBP2118836.1 putative damage-inducible protein DinB [Cohnella lubricantis]
MQTIRNMFKQLNWANERILAHLRTQDNNEQAVRLFAHILRAEQVWLARLTGKDSSPIALWSDANLTDCSRWIEENKENFQAYLAAIEEGGSLDHVIEYKNQAGTSSYSTSVRDILTHVALHGQYHRGQINSMLRAAGGEPVSVDYIVFARED